MLASSTGTKDDPKFCDGQKMMIYRDRNIKDGNLKKFPIFDFVNCTQKCFETYECIGFTVASKGVRTPGGARDTRSRGLFVHSAIANFYEY